MRFTKETVEAINKEYYAVKEAHSYFPENRERGIYMSNGFESSVYAGIGGNGWHIADVEDLRATIDELEMFAEAITKVTGVVI